MPLRACRRGGQSGWQYGDTGKCYVGPGSKRRALAQAVAIDTDRKRRGEEPEFVEKDAILACEEVLVELSDREINEFLLRHQASMVEILLDEPTDRVSIKKTAAAEQKLWAEVYIPGFPDTHGATMTRTEIANMAHEFLSKGRVRRLNIGHSCKHDPDTPCDCGMGSVVIESFQAGDRWETSKGSGQFWTPGSWVVGVEVPSKDVWRRIERGEINGLSMEALVLMRDIEVDLWIPDDGVVRGKTLRLMGDSHEHDWEVRFGPDGGFLGGMTTATRGAPHHVHRCQGMTFTDRFEGNGLPVHGHRFSVPDEMQMRVAA